MLAESDDCTKIIGLDGALQYMSEGGQRVMEVDDFLAIAGCPWPDFWQGVGNTAAVAALDAARRGESARFEGVANTAKGIPAIGCEGVSNPGMPTESRKRIKNLLALVQAIANQTLREDEHLSVAKPAFLARLTALAMAQDLTRFRSTVVPEDRNSSASVFDEELPIAEKIAIGARSTVLDRLSAVPFQFRQRF